MMRLMTSFQSLFYECVHGERIMPFVCLIDDIIVDKRHRVEELKDDSEIQDSFFIFSAKAFVGQSESIRSDSFPAGKNERSDIIDETIDLLIADKLFRLVYFFLDIGLQDAVEGSFE
jgi:hypothetical protein